MAAWVRNSSGGYSLTGQATAPAAGTGSPMLKIIMLGGVAALAFWFFKRRK